MSVDPAVLAAQQAAGTPAAPVAPAPAAPAPAPAAVDPKLAQHAQLLKQMSEEPEAVVEYIAKLRKENAGRRTFDMEQAEAKIAQLEADKRTAEESKLKEQNDYKALYERQEAERKEEVKVAKQVMIDKSLEAKCLAEGINPKWLKLVDRKGLIVDGNTVLGLDAAIDRFKIENPELVAQPAPAAIMPGAVVPGAAAAPGMPPGSLVPAAIPAGANPYDYMIMPGTNMTYAQHARMSGALAPAQPGTPAPQDPRGGAAKPEQFKTKQEADDWYNKTYRPSLKAKK